MKNFYQNPLIAYKKIRDSHFGVCGCTDCGRRNIGLFAGKPEMPDFPFVSFCFLLFAF